MDSESCDGIDNDGDGSVDEGQPDADLDGVCDDIDSEDCDGLDNDGDGSADEDFDDLDGNGIADCFESEDVCDGTDDDGDGVIDEDPTNTTGFSPMLGSYHSDGAPVVVISTDTSQTTPLMAGGSEVSLGVSGVTTSAYNPADGLLYMVTGDNDEALMNNLDEFLMKKLKIPSGILTKEDINFVRKIKMSRNSKVKDEIIVL